MREVPRYKQAVDFNPEANPERLRMFNEICPGIGYRYYLENGHSEKSMIEVRVNAAHSLSSCIDSPEAKERAAMEVPHLMPGKEGDLFLCQVGFVEEGTGRKFLIKYLFLGETGGLVSIRTELEYKREEPLPEGWLQERVEIFPARDEDPESMEIDRAMLGTMADLLKKQLSIEREQDVDPPEFVGLDHTQLDERLLEQVLTLLSENMQTAYISAPPALCYDLETELTRRAVVRCIKDMPNGLPKTELGDLMYKIRFDLFYFAFTANPVWKDDHALELLHEVAARLPQDKTLINLHPEGTKRFPVPGKFRLSDNIMDPDVPNLDTRPELEALLEILGNPTLPEVRLLAS